MIFDDTNLLSNDQAITASAASEDIIDLGAPGTVLNGPYPLNRDIGRGTPIPLLVQVTVSFATLTSLKVAVQSGDVEGFTGQIDTVIETEAIPLAKLTAGYQFVLNFVPKGVKHRYVRLYYTVAGSNATAGKVTAGVTMGNQDVSMAGGV